ncbi:MAG: hypothetical protein JXB85_09855 [Anaerolineales bacterium]|nr:hypothetical protein [Anaerolineales bacterium]
MFPTLDAQEHRDPSRPAEERSTSGAILAMALDLDEAGRGLAQIEPLITWGVRARPHLSKFGLHAPLERARLESDPGTKDPPAVIPCRVERAEHLVAQQSRPEAGKLRRVVWQNLARRVSRNKHEASFPGRTGGPIG